MNVGKYVVCLQVILSLLNLSAKLGSLQWNALTGIAGTDSFSQATTWYQLVDQIYDYSKSYILHLNMEKNLYMGRTAASQHAKILFVMTSSYKYFVC